MSSAAVVAIHPSQFPEAVRAALLTSLRRKKLDHRFHYDSVKQTHKWLALHQRYSPSRHDPDCTRIYDDSFRAAARLVGSQTVHVLGLGCGGGQKDTRLLKLLKRTGKHVFYTPCDVSTAMVLVARQAALAVLPDDHCFPAVCDLSTTGDLRSFLVTRHPSPRRAVAPQRRLVTFFGMIPNFEPDEIMPKLVKLIRPKDRLLFSANLAPGHDYSVGMKQILPQYDNAPTHDWLMTFLLDLGVDPRDGRLRFEIETIGVLKRVVARFHFRRSRAIAIDDQVFSFKAGDAVRLFFSYRYTPDRVVDRLKKHGLTVENQWITRSEEEGVFLCRKK